MYLWTHQNRMFEIETDHRTPRAHGGPALTVSLAGQLPRVEAASVPFGTLFLVLPAPPQKRGEPWWKCDS